MRGRALVFWLAVSSVMISGCAFQNADNHPLTTNSALPVAENASAAKSVKPAEARNETIELSDDEIRELLIRQSLASYSGPCPCPEFRDRAGRRCGKRSAYSRPGGASPLCYETDVSPQMIVAFRSRQRGSQ